MNGRCKMKTKYVIGYYIDKFEEKIECSFQDANDFNDSGSAFVFSNNKWTLLKLYRLCR